MSKRKNSKKYSSANDDFRPRGRKTAPGTHIPVMLKEVTRESKLKNSEVIVDCTLGYGGHAEHLAKLIAPAGKLIGLDVDGAEIKKTSARLAEVLTELPETCTNFVHESYDKLPEVLENIGLGTTNACDVIFADLGVSSMQVDDKSRGIGYKYEDAPLDMRMDSRLAKTAADVLKEADAEQLTEIFSKYADEPDAAIIAQWITAQREVKPFEKTGELIRLILNAKGVTENTWRKNEVSDFGRHHPAARVFQALRIQVNDEFGRLERLLKNAETLLKPGGRLLIISFHSGEDKITACRMQAGLEAGIYSEITTQAIEPSKWEKRNNWRSSSAKLRVAVKAS